MTGTSTDKVRTELESHMTEQRPAPALPGNGLVITLFHEVVALRIVSWVTEFGVFRVPRAA